MQVTKVFKFGLLPPTKNGEMVADQMRKAHAYQNQLVRIENDRRESIRSIGQEINAEIARLEVELEEKEGEIQSAFEEVGKRHSANRDKATEKSLRARVTLLKKERKEIGDKLKELRAELKGDPRAKELTIAANGGATQQRKEARKECGAYWGSYLLKEAAVDAAADKQPLNMGVRFKRWEGSGKIGVQIQTQTGDEPTRIEDIFAGRCTLIQIDPVDRDIFALPRGQRKRLSRTTLRFRVGSDKSKRAIFAEFPMILHRPIPVGSIITGATVSRNMFGPRAEWTVEISAKFEAEEPQSIAGEVAIDVGWRQLETVRVATWAATDGQSGKVDLPDAVRTGLAKVDSLKGIRSTNFDEAREYLQAWLKLGKAPEWLKERTATLHAWKSIGKLAAVVKRWKDNRFDGDEAIYPRLEKWRYNDYHLWAWECGLRRSVLRQRKDFYRNFAAGLARKYGAIVMEDFDLTKVAKRPELHENDGDNETARANRHAVAVSELRLCLENAFGKHRVKKVNPANTSKTCNKCKSIQDIGSALTHKCTACGAEYDRDENAALNILEKGADAAPISTRVPKRIFRARKKPRERQGDVENVESARTA